MNRPCIAFKLNYYNGGAKFTEIFREVFVVDKNTEQRDDKSKIYLTTENSPELKKKMDKISAELLKRNKNLYKRLANAC